MDTSFKKISFDEMGEYKLPKRYVFNSDLRDVFEFEDQMLMIVVGTPGAGKTRFTLHALCDMARRYQHPSLIASPEMHPRIVYNVIEQYCRAHKDDSPKRLVKLLTADGRMTVRDTLDYAARVQGLRWLALDPYNQFEVNDPKISTERKQMEDLGYIGWWKHQHDTGVILVTHPTKAVLGDNGKVREPTAYDIAGSAHFYNRADKIAALSRLRSTGGVDKVKLNVQKIRNQQGNYRPTDDNWFVVSEKTGLYIKTSPPAVK